MKTQYSIRTLCAALQVSPSGYYDWCQRQTCPGPRAQADAHLRQRILAIFLEHRQTYGSPRIQRQLARQGARHGRNRIARLMRQAALCGRQKARFRAVTTDSRHAHPIAPNRLAQTAPPTAPNQTWVSDITYIATGQGWLYLAAIMDLYSRRIVGWALSQRLDATLILSAWQRAVGQRQPPPGLLFHSDRGVQFACADFRHALATAQAQASMSRKACCYDNAAMESFWSTLKLELVYRTHFTTFWQATVQIAQYIESFYNRKRSHSALNFSSPVDFECHLN